MQFIEQNLGTIYVIGFFISSFLVGYLDGLSKPRSRKEVDMSVYAISIIWPLALSVVLVLLLFVIIGLPGVIGSGLADGTLKDLFKEKK